MSHARTPASDQLVSRDRDTSPSRSTRVYAGSAVMALAGAAVTGALGVTTAAVAAPVSHPSAAAASSSSAATMERSTTTVHTSVSASNDTYANSKKPTHNYGHKGRLLVGSAHHRHQVAYVKFTVPAAARGHITSARIVLDRNAHHLSTTIALHAVNNHWNESHLNSRNAPANKGQLGRRSTTAATSVVAFNLKPASLNGRKKVSFSVTSKSKADTAQFVSSNASRGPRLELTYSTTTATPARSVGSRFAQLGLAVPGGNPSEFQAAADAELHSTWSRLYASGSVPASLGAWPDAKAAAATGSKLWLSLALNVSALASGQFDASLAAFVKTLPAGTRVTTNHEPSNKRKGISPSQFAAAYNHAARVILNASSGRVLPGPIEVQANVVRQGYLDKLNPALVKFVGLDGYDGIGGPQNANRSFAQVSGASFAYSRKLFPGTPIGFAEFNTSRNSGWAQWVADSLAWCKSVGADTAVLFTSLDYWRKTPAELHSLAVILNK